MNRPLRSGWPRRSSWAPIRVSALGVAIVLFAGIASAARVITLAPHLTELVCAAGACDQLVGVSAYSDFPESVKRLPQIGNGFTVNHEQLLALKPDWVFAWNGGTPVAEIAKLRGLGLRVEPITASRLDDVAAALETIGADLGTAPAAHTAAAAYRNRLAALHERWRNASPLRVVYQVGTSPAYSINAQSPISDALGLCGGINVFGGMPQIAAPIGAESMLAARPDVVLYASSEDAAAIRHYWANLPGATVTATQGLFAVNADWLARATPRLLDGVEQVCGILDGVRRQRAAASGAAGAPAAGH